MLINTQGIVIKTIKYGETSVITHLFTRLGGLKSFIVNGVRTKRSTMPFGLFQPGTLLECTMYHHDQKKLLRLKEARIAQAWQKIPFDIKRSSVALFICELLEKTIRDAEGHETLYDDTIAYLHYIDTTQQSLANLPLHYLIDLSHHLGFGPQGEYTENNQFFDLQEGYFMSSPYSLHYIDKETSPYLSQLLVQNYSQQALFTMSREVRRLIFDHLLKYYSLHIENFPALHSPEVFRSVMEL